MPNHVTNIIKVVDLGSHSEAELRANLLNEQGQVDFNSICRSPAILKGLVPDCDTVDRAKCALGLMSFDGPEFMKDIQLSNIIKTITTPAAPEKKEMLLQCIQAGIECGYVYWHDWNRENWGTKWNAYGQPEDGYPIGTTEFKFETAWSHPSALMQSLSKRLPGATFHISYADEDMGSNCGEYFIKAGEIERSDIAPAWSEMSPEERKKYLRFAFVILHPGDDPAKHGFDAEFNYSDELYEANNG